jgi:hypothetical protein
LASILGVIREEQGSQPPNHGIASALCGYASEILGPPQLNPISPPLLVEIFFYEAGEEKSLRGGEP